MRSFFLLGLIGLAAAQGSSSNSTASATSSASGAAITVATDGSGQYTAIGEAVTAAQNSGIPTVTILAGTYTEFVSVAGTQTVTLVGETAAAVSDWSENLVAVSAPTATPTAVSMSSGTKGVAFKNINFINNVTSSSNAVVAKLQGDYVAFYGCSLISVGATAVSSSYGTTLIAYSYIEGSDKLFYNYPTIYIYGSTISPTTSSANIVYTKGTTIDSTFYNSTVVFDTSSIEQKSGSSNTGVYLAAPNSNGAQAIFRGTSMGSFINAAGIHSSASGVQTYYGEFETSGDGSYDENTSSRQYEESLTADEVSEFTIDKVFAAAFSPYGITDLSWIDEDVLAAISSSDESQIESYNATIAAIKTYTYPTNATVNAHPDSGTVPPVDAVIVSVDGSNNASFTNLTAALDSLPNDDTNQTIFLYPGSYNEQVPSIDRSGPVRIIGYTSGSPGQSYADNEVTITYSRGLSVSPLPAGHSDAETATLATESNRISFYNIDIINTDNLDGATSSYVTLAASIYGNDIAFYGCSFIGWQDTLLTGQTNGYQYYESCYIDGAIDYIWGYSKAYFKGCTLASKRAKSCITAQSRADSSAIGGYIFDQCLFTEADGVSSDVDGTVYLGRPYSAYALVVVKNSYLDSVISPSGWKIWSTSDPRTDHIAFAEFNNSGPSNWENNTAAREAFGNATLLTEDDYPLESVMDSTEWIDMTFWNSIITPQPTVENVTAVNTTVSGNSTYDGTTPPSDAIIVSKTAIDGVTTYETIQEAINAAPTSSKTNATIFIYPGTYNEQLVLNKSGTTIFQGYSEATADYSQNQVTITQSYGVDTGADQSNSDSATVFAKGNYFYAYNVNFRNDNGTQEDIASLGFAVQSSKYAALYSCQVYGNQDTLYISGNLFTFQSYIEGNVDFIYGSGSAYFLDTTISPNEDGVSITADKRASNTTMVGMVFDQCTLQPVSGSTFTNVALGRPWNSYARVAYIYSYFDSMISAAGWNQWSTSSPQTDGVVFGEYNNYGPGASICSRADFSTQLSDDDVVQFQLANFFASTSWIDFSKINVQPFTVGVGSAQTCENVTETASSTMSSTTMSETSTSSVSLTSATATSTVTLSLAASSSTVASSTTTVSTSSTTTTVSTSSATTTTSTITSSSSTTIAPTTSSTTSSTTIPTTTSARTTTSSRTPTTTSTSSTSTQSAVAAYGQCGGANYAGSTTCVDGWTCQYQNDYYYQCVAATTTSTPTTSTTLHTSTSKATTSTTPSRTTTLRTTTTARGHTTTTAAWGRSRTTTTSSLRRTTTTAASACATAYAQCGGSGWSGATCCVSGWTCRRQNGYYSQCVSSGRKRDEFWA
ncbi:hypothetical protein M8818_003639 [Zalaria obscura]|uniref:Uncharacterized protein n=1 Tax=Zalaria obscura TaxID=2024903 RepID=A0ACC3SEA7_9PEZI